MRRLFHGAAVGGLIDRIGERPVLAFYNTVLIGLFCGYAFVTTKYLLYAIFLFDGFLGVCTTAFSTYVGRLAPKAEHTAVFSMGVAMNHIAAVSMPLVGGILWKTLGYQWAFLVGIPAALASLALVSRLPNGPRPRLSRAPPVTSVSGEGGLPGAALPDYKEGIERP